MKDVDRSAGEKIRFEDAKALLGTDAQMIDRSEAIMAIIKALRFRDDALDAMKLFISNVENVIESLGIDARVMAVNALKNQRESYEEEILILREALLPFADLPVVSGPNEKTMLVTVPCGDIRRARRAIKGKN